MDLKITQRPGQIGLNIQKPQVKLSITPPRENVSYNKAEVLVTAKDPKVRIDQTQVFADIGLRKPIMYRDYVSSLAESKGLEGIARLVQEGNSLGAIEKGNTVGSVITSQDRAEAECPFTIGFIPEHAPIIEAEVENLQIEAPPGGVTLGCELGGVENNAPWAKVEMYLLQKPYFDIEWIGSHYDAIT